MLVRPRCVETFMKVATHEAYLEGIGCRTAAIEDERLRPLAEIGAIHAHK